MVRPPAARARAVLIGAALALFAGPAPAATPASWEVTVAVRLNNDAGAPVSVRIALPPNDELQELGDVDVQARGLTATVVRDGDEPHVELRGKLKGARRIAVSYVVHRERAIGILPVIGPLDAPPPALLPFLMPSPTFQSRSILVRDFLETNAAPILSAPGAPDLVRTLHQVTREHFTWAGDGKTLTLDVIRSGSGKRIGIERVFTTFLRCAHIPARFVEGINLASTTHRKRVFWTEVWGQNRWWPLSASLGWIGRLPKAYIALTRDGQRAVQIEGAVESSYAIQARPLPDTPS
ncbi:MAG TPA: transglutaminase-like domain-containing protein [Candidatus Dormibacteraeota bacterium]|nr:transglutaminase-like domain-containing protein [Candidatus Dormibacteraeota bacterium]